jgi:ribosomal protein L40E
MEEEHKKSKISLSKPEDIPQEQPNNDYNYDIPYQQSGQPYESQYQGSQYSQTQQTTYQNDTARTLPRYDMPNTYQQTNSPVPRNNSPYQQSNYARSQQNTQTKFCQRCGNKIPIDARVCTKCGQQVGAFNLQSNSVSTKSRGVSIALCVLGFFGLAGIHRLYTGKIWSGLLYFLTSGLFGIGTIVDLVRLIQGNFTDNDGRTLKD